MKKRAIIVSFMILLTIVLGLTSNYFWQEVGTDFMVLSVEE